MIIIPCTYKIYIALHESISVIIAMTERNNVHVICYVRKVGTYLYETSNIYPKHMSNVYL